MANSAYQPSRPAQRPGGKPSDAPAFRVLVHRQYYEKYTRLADVVGIKQAQELWDYLAMTPDKPPSVGACCILKGKAGDPQDVGWSRRATMRLHQRFGSTTSSIGSTGRPKAGIRTLS